MQLNKFIKMEPIWLVLFGMTLIVFFWFFTKVLFGAYDYMQLSEAVVPKMIHWHVVESRPDYYQIKAKYSFIFKDKRYDGEFLFKDKEYGNTHLAHEAIKVWLQMPMKIWINKNNPALASMHRAFPVRDLIRAILAFAVFVYFVWLKLHTKDAMVSEGK